MPLATTENSGFSVLLRLVHCPAGEPPSAHSARGSASGGVCLNLWSLPFSRHVEDAVTFSALAQRRKQNTMRRMGISGDAPLASLCEGGACLRAREQQVEYLREPTCLSNRSKKTGRYRLIVERLELPASGCQHHDHDQHHPAHHEPATHAPGLDSRTSNG